MTATVWTGGRSEQIPTTTTSDGNSTLSRHTLFGNLYLVHGTKSVLVGGMQSFEVEEINNTQFRASIGSDWLEPVWGMRMWQGQGSRMIIRTASLQAALGSTLSQTGFLDLDFRLLPFQWQYFYQYTNVYGTKNFDVHLNNWFTVYITNYRWAAPGPNELITENFNFIAKGFSNVAADPTTGTTYTTIARNNPALIKSGNDHGVGLIANTTYTTQSPTIPAGKSTNLGGGGVNGNGGPMPV